MFNKKFDLISLLIVILLLILYSSSWYFFHLDVGGVAIINISEIIVLLLFLFNIKYIGNVMRDLAFKRLVRTFVIIAILFFIYSMYLKINGHVHSYGIGEFKRIFYFPILGLLTGKLLQSRYYNNGSRVVFRSIKGFPFLVLLLLIVNLFIGFREVKDNTFVVRFDAFIILMNLLFIFEKKYSRKKIEGNNIGTSYIKQIFYLILILLTFSRGVILSISITILIFFIIYTKSLFSKIKFILSLSVIVIIVMIGLNFSSTAVKQINKEIGGVEGFFYGHSGHSGENVNDLDLRYYRYISAYNSAMENPIFGGGLGHRVAFYIGGDYNKYEDTNTEHNFILTLWIRIGIVGVILFLWFIIQIGKNIQIVPIRLTFFAAYLYSLVDVMMSSQPAAILSIFLIVGYYFGINPKSDNILINLKRV